MIFKADNATELDYYKNSYYGYEKYKVFNSSFAKHLDMKELYKKIATLYFKEPHPSGIYCDKFRLVELSKYVRQGVFFMSDLNLSNLSLQQFEILNFTNAMPMFAAWRNTLGIYQIDNDIFDEMLKSPIPDDTPSIIFKNIPEFCVYIEFPRFLKYSEINESRNGQEFRTKGLWVYFTYEYDNLQLNICSDVDVTATPVPFLYEYLSLPINENWTVKQASEQVFKQYKDPNKTPEYNLALAKADQNALMRFLPIVLWLCVQEPDISNIQGEPITINQIKNKKQERNKKTGVFVAPSTPTYYKLGQRLGGEIRKYKDLIKSDKESRKTASKRPHIRKGHYHGYWIGTGQDKHFITKWLPAIFVNA